MVPCKWCHVVVELILREDIQTKKLFNSQNVVCVGRKKSVKLPELGGGGGGGLGNSGNARIEVCFLF